MSKRNIDETFNKEQWTPCAVTVRKTQSGDQPSSRWTHTWSCSSKAHFTFLALQKMDPRLALPQNATIRWRDPPAWVGSSSLELYKASHAGDVDAVRDILLRGQYEPFDELKTSLSFSCLHGHPDIAKILLSDPRLQPQILYRILCPVVLKGRVEVVKFLLADCRVDPTAEDNKLIYIAAARGYTDIVKLLLQDPLVDPTARNYKALAKAVRYKRTDTVQVLLQDDRIKHCKTYNEIIKDAIMSENWSMVKILKANAIIRVFRKANALVCMARIRQFLLTRWILHPDSPYVKRLGREFHAKFGKK
jgi:hypothetical protein